LSREENKSSFKRMPSRSAPRLVRRWVRRASATHEEAWRAKLAFLGPSVVIHSRPGSTVLRLEAYGPDRVLRRLEHEHGGRIETINAAAIVARANAPRAPLRLTHDLAVIDAHGQWPASQPAPRHLLRITGAMAFGTGEHATTAACLRFLRDKTSRLTSGWTALDIGTGSGILAIAAEKLGAARVEAFDYDPLAIRAARANARRNHCRRLKFSTQDLLRWHPTHRHPVVVANVFSEILRRAARRITASVEPGGTLILSGILRTQEKETLATFTARGFAVEKAARRGKWVTLQLQRRPGRTPPNRRAS